MSCIVRNFSKNKVAKGGSIYVCGAGFSWQTKAWIGASEAVILDYNYDVLKIAAISVAGCYPLYIGETYENRREIGCFTIVDDVNALPIDVPARHSEESVRNAFLGLLPRGFAWYKGEDGVFARLMRGFAWPVIELYRLAAEFRRNTSPSHTESFAEWERELYLPENGTVVSGSDQEVAMRRRAEIFRKACRKGGCTIPYFKSICALFGVTAEIYEYWSNPEKFEGVNFSDDDPNFYWMVSLASRDEDWFVCTCNDTCNDYLQCWWNAPIESILNLLKPSHTKLIYSYGDGSSSQGICLLTESGTKLKTETCDNIVV